MSFVMLEPQPRFPVEDISDTNAAILELLLLHLEIVQTSHVQAEATSFLYKVSHLGLTAAIGTIMSSPEQQQAFSFGVTLFESMSTLVRSLPNINGHNSFETNAKFLTAYMNLTNNFVAAASEHKAHFKEELPKATTVIGSSAARFYKGHEDYVISGAATARSLELDAA